MKLVHRINEISTSTENLSENEILEQEIKSIKELYEKKKSILIPKTACKSSKPGHTINEEYSNTFYERPSRYINYGEVKRDENNLKFKQYEATQKEIEYLNKNDPSITVEQYEQAITALENDVDKGEMIPKERAIEVLMTTLQKRDQDTYEKIYEVST